MLFVWLVVIGAGIAATDVELKSSVSTTLAAVGAVVGAALATFA